MKHPIYHLKKFEFVAPYTQRVHVDLLVIIEEGHTGVDPEVEIAAGIAHPFPMDILVCTRQQIAKRLRLGDSFLRDVVEKGVVLYERPAS